MKRFFLSFILTASLLLGGTSCEFPHPQQSPSTEPSRPTPSSKPVAKDGLVAILSVNDMHSAIDLMPQFAALADSLRQLYPDLLVFSAGDNRTGNPVNDQFEPASYPMIALMNKVGFNLCAVGNHEWDGGVEALQKNIEDADFPYLCANIRIPKDVKLDVKPYEILTVQGLKIGVVGMLELRANGYPGAHPRYFKKLSFERAEDAMQDYLFLRKQCDIFILLSHLGYEEDLEMAERYPSLDAIIGGHSHTLVEYPSKHHGVMVTQAGSSLKYATLTLLTVEKGKVVDVTAKTIDVQHFKKKNKEVKALLDQFNNESCFNEVLATAVTPFDNKEELGCLLTDAIRVVSGADFAFNNTGGIRLNRMKKGPITIKDVYEIDPFANEIVVYSMKGKQLERFIMESYKKNGRYPSFVSGMRYVVNTASDGYPKSVSITLDKGRFSPDAVYTVAMNSFMASTVRFDSVDEGTSLYMTSEEMLIEFLKKQKTVSYQGVSRVN